MKILVSIGLKENSSSCKERCVSHDGEWSGYIRDLEYGGGGEDTFQFIESGLLKGGPVPGFILPGE